MSGAFEPWIWPYERLDEALRALVRRCGLGDAQAPLAFTPPALAQTDVDALSRWIERLADWLGVEAEPLEASYPELEQLVRGAAPALLQVSSERGVGFAVVVRGGRSLSLLTPELELVKVPAQQVRATLCRTLEQPALARADALLDASGVAPERRAVARGALVRQWLSTVSIAGCWLVRPLPGAPLATLLRHARAGRRLAVALAGYAAQSALGLAGWWLMGRGAFEGKLEHAWLLAWVLVQLSTVPLSLCSSWAWGQLSIDLGALFRQRLLAGALALDLEQLRHQGAGQLLGRVLDARAVEQQVLTGGFGALVSALDLLAAGLVLAAGAAATGQLLLLAAWLLLALAIGGAYLARWRSWTLLRIELSNDLIEAMVGHRTRLAQERRERWHEGEDGALERYLAHSLALDQSALWAGAALSRGFLLFGLTALAPAFIAGDATPARLAVSVGGVLLAARALRGLAAGLTSVAGAAVAWENVAPLFRAAAEARAGQAAGSPVLAAAAPRRAARGEPLIEAHDLVYRYPSRPVPALSGVTLRMAEGDRVLLEGPSGGGKSTLGAVLAGLRLPESGTLLLRGLDRGTWGSEGFRRRVVAAPQFHENHVISATLAFNLLMGRRWPARPEDLEQAEALCRALALGPLLDRMPAGLAQLVGETGWQLSHGERSRLYIARALLQDPELLLLDESFAALDPATLASALRCVLERAPSLLVIAHP